MSGPNDSEDRIAALATELGRLGRRLDDMAGELSALGGQGAPGRRSTPEPGMPGAASAAPQASGATPTGHPEPPAYPAQLRPGPVPAAYPGYPRAWPPGAPAYPAPQYPGPYPATRPPARTPADRAPLRTWPAALSGARLLAWTGAAVTLLGVVLLLALAASRGWFSPAGRVIAGAALGAALVGLAMWLHRRESARTGALALAGTGIATLYLVVAAATALHGFLPAMTGLVLALIVAGGGLGLADRWRSPVLAAGTVAGAAVLAPAVTDGFVPLLVALVLALQLAAIPVVLRRRSSWLAGVAAAGPVFFGALTAVVSGSGDARAATVAAVVAVLVIGVAAAVLAARPLRVAPVAGLLAAAPVPVLVLSAVLGRWGGAGLAAGAAVLLLVVAAWSQLDRALRIAALSAGSVALFVATVVALNGAAENAVLLGEAIVLAIVAGVLRSRIALIIGGVFGAIGVLVALGGQVPLRALVIFPAEPFLVGGQRQTAALVAGTGVAALMLAFAVAVLLAAARIGMLRGDPASARLWVPAGAVALYGGAGLVVGLALLISSGRTGFVAGHAVVTVSWTVVALVLLARGISRPALRITGLVLVAAAVAKLILFDLVALDGIARVAAFLGAGLVLLAAGSRYARLVAEAADEPDEPDEADHERDAGPNRRPPS